ncbi:hypothetical protein ACOSQ2_017306 [Xanthoceras sorbifolium]
MLVQGHPVTFTVELVNEYFQLPNFPELVGGWVEHEFFQLYNYDLARSLREDKDSRRWGQDIGQHEAVPLEHGQPQAQPTHDDRILTAIAEMQASFKGRVELLQARINSRLDVMKAGMIGLGDRMNTMGRKIDRIKIAVIQHYSRQRSRTLPQLPSK